MDYENLCNVVAEYEKWLARAEEIVSEERPFRRSLFERKEVRVRALVVGAGKVWLATEYWRACEEYDDFEIRREEVNLHLLFAPDDIYAEWKAGVEAEKKRERDHWAAAQAVQESANEQRRLRQLIEKYGVPDDLKQKKEDPR